jgi:hypothetical protein
MLETHIIKIVVPAKAAIQVMGASLISSCPRKREPSVLCTPLGPRFRGDDESFSKPVTHIAKPSYVPSVQYLAFPGVRGNGMTSRTLESPVA